jgi:hypothetical protein
MKHWLWLSLAVLVLDQATKWLVLGLLEPFEVIELIPNLNLTLMFNTGAAFSFLADAGGWQRWLFALVAVGITVALTVWLLRLKSGEGGWRSDWHSDRRRCRQPDRPSPARSCGRLHSGLSSLHPAGPLQSLALVQYRRQRHQCRWSSC